MCAAAENTSKKKHPANNTDRVQENLFEKLRLAQFLISVLAGVAELEFDLHEAVVLADTVCTAEGTGLDLAAVGGDCDVCDGGVLGLAGAVAGDSGVAVTVCHLYGVQGLCERADLVDLDEDAVAGAHLDTLLEVLDVGYEEVVTYELALGSDCLGELDPAFPVFL